jgi:NAD(P)-dependent dehydrogenase (short-subunit alcohol dehydrogenase family)
MGAPRLEGKVAIVTGAGTIAEGMGNGKAAAILFAREGARVLLADRRPEAAEETLAAINEEGGTASIFAADVSNEDDCRAMVGEALRLWGRLDILDNNVGIEALGPITEVSNEHWELVLRVNTTGTMFCCRHAIPAMTESGGGAIVNISSVAAWKGRGLATYAASKGAIEALTRALALDHAREGIRVNCIEPGVVYTPHVYAHGMTEEQRERRRRASALQIEGTAWDVAYAALFLVSDEARYITGVVLPVDGGLLLR